MTYGILFVSALAACILAIAAIDSNPPGTVMDKTNLTVITPHTDPAR
jgi:hypothetical protein